MEFFIIKTTIPEQILQQSAFTQMSAQQSPGQLCPVFNISEAAILRNTRIGEFNINTWEKLPQELTISFVDIDWDCYQTTPKTTVTTAGVERTTQYVPKIMRELTKSYGQSVYFFSCTRDRFLQAKKRLNEDDVEIFFWESDNYPTKGCTVQNVIETMGDLIGINIVYDLPSLYTGNIVLQYNPSSSIIQFIQSLIPTLVETILLATNDTLTISFIDPAGSPSQIAYPTNISGYEITEIDFPLYDAYEITGGMGKPDKTRYYNIKTIEPEERVTNAEKETSFCGQPATVYIETTYMTDQFENPFYTVSEKETTVGKIWRNAYGDYSNDKTVSEMETTFNNEFVDPFLYAKTRLVGKQKVFSGYVNAYIPNYFSNVEGRALYLLNTMEIIDYDTVMERWPDSLSFSDILLTAYQNWEDGYETHAETWEYTSEEDADEWWFEGSLRNNIITISRTAIRFSYAGTFSQYYDITIPIDQVLSAVVSDIIVRDLTVTTISVSTQTFDLETRRKTIAPCARGEYVFRRTINTLDLATQATVLQEDEETIGSDQIPSAPIELRRQRLKYREGDFGEKKLIYPVTAGISSCNWDDLEIWTAFLQHKNIESQSARTWRHVPYPLLPGQTYNACKVVGFSIIESASGGYDIGLNTKGFIASNDLPL